MVRRQCRITVPLWDGDATRNVIVPGVTFP